MVSMIIYLIRRLRVLEHFRQNMLDIIPISFLEQIESKLMD